MSATPPATADARAAYATMYDALRATGRPIVNSIREWGTHRAWEWATAAGGNLWRTTGDISDLWGGAEHNDHRLGVVDILDRQVGLPSLAGIRRIHLDWSAPNLPRDRPMEVRDLWLSEPRQRPSQSMSAEVRPHAAVMWKLTPVRSGVH